MFFSGITQWMKDEVARWPEIKLDGIMKISAIEDMRRGSESIINEKISKGVTLVTINP